MRRRDQSGFSMIDTICALAVTAIIGGVAVPGANELLDSYHLRSAANQIAFLIDRGRMQAATQGRVVCVRVGGGRAELRTGAVTAASCDDEEPLAVLKLPSRVFVTATQVRFDGSGTAVERPLIRVETGAGSLLVVTDVLGRVRVS
jgi:Tfp pilus assembly protein FimT